MKKSSRLAVVVLWSVLVIGACTRSVEPGLRERAARLAHEVIIIDGHVDAPYRLGREDQDLSVRTESGEFDYVRAREGGLDAPFMSIYTPARMERTGGSRALADSLIGLVEGFASEHPDKFAVASSPDEVEGNFRAGLVSLCMGMENGSPIEGDLANLRHFYERGVRYVTLTHSEDNHICDSSYDTTRTWHGLSPFGRTVVAEMNRLGIMVDISHVSDDAFWQVMDITKAPVIASHSSCRSFVPGFERNMNDDMIRRLAENGGVIQINFGSMFISKRAHDSADDYSHARSAYLSEHGFAHNGDEDREFKERYFAEHPFPFADVQDVADHIDHVVALVGVDHVGLGSDFDGVGEALPVGLKDVSQYPNLIHELLVRGYSERDIEKIASGNVLRVWRKVERFAAASGR